MHDLAGTGGGHTLSLMARIWRPSIISPIGVTSRSIFDRRSKANGNNEFSLLSRSDIFLAAHSRRSYDCVKTPHHGFRGVASRRVYFMGGLYLCHTVLLPPSNQSFCSIENPHFFTTLKCKEFS